MSWRCLSLLVLAIIRPAISQFDSSQCRISKGCHIPEPSQSNGMGVAWNLIDDETLELELFVNAEQENGRYVAVGFSDDEHMGNEPVIECSAIGNQPVSMKFSFDKVKGKGNERVPGDFTAHFSDSTTSFENGILYCKSKVKVSGSSSESKIFKFDPNTEYHLLLANGKTTAKGLGYHKEQSSVSRKIRLAEVSPGFDEGECGKSKGCTMPAADSCYNVDGNIGASYRVVSPTEIEFEIFGPANTTVNENVYVGLGFSNDEKMNDISVIECSKLPKEMAPSMKFSYNEGFKNVRIQGEEPIRAKLINQLDARINDGKIYCKGVVNVGGDADNSRIFKWNKSQGYHLMFAAGFTNDDGLTQHWGSCVSILTFLDQVDNVGFKDTTCGVTKGCFSLPNCTDECTRTSWSVMGPNQIHVELSGKADTLNKYIAMGFSTNGRMGNTSVIECSSFNDSPFSMSFSYNSVGENYYRNLRPTSDISSLFTNQRVQYVDGILYCSADVRVEGDANDLTVFKYDPAANYSIILATGNTTTNGTVQSLKYHHTERSVAPFQKLSDYAPPTAAPPPSGTGTFDPSTCGRTKACFTTPTGNDEVSYRVIDDASMEIEIFSTQSSSSGVYTALGFSATDKMSPASVIECSSLGSQPLSMKFSSNDGYSNSRIDGEEAIRAQYITNTETSYNDGKIYCRGTVKVDGNANSQIFKYNPSEMYHLLVAKGSATAGGLSYHGPTKYSSDARLLSNLNAGNGSGSKMTLVILHAIFMTIAWMTMVPIAVIFARVLRSSWPTLKPGGLLIWFHIHRGANLIGIALMIAGFVLILIHKDWKFVNTGWGGKHAIIGIIALCLAWLQPFISTLRCSPNDPRRPIFNYIHRGVGVVAMVLATTAVCIAGYHFTAVRNVPQLVLALIPISVILALSVFFLIFNKIVDVDTKSFTKNGNSVRTEDIPMRPTSKSGSETTWTIQSPESENSPNNHSSSNREVPAEKKKLWVNRFREFVVYGAVLIFVAIGTILSVFFGLGLSN